MANPARGLQVRSYCAELKPLVAFHRMRSMVKGRHPRCKECRRNERIRTLN
jgi:hypothetical protein